MRTLILAGLAAGALITGIGPAAAAPLPLIDVSGTPVATDTAGTDSSLTGSATQSASGIAGILCLLTNPHCWSGGTGEGHVS
ncbi:hypothetical protein ACFXO9_36395 [Nocardia tengchongensis]|uniref:hypothetical protein n=1 Tax=Nocardia tengchongensis TaxID=2055889 RepID=UPI00368A7BFF